MIKKICLTWMQLKWIRYGVLMITLALCSTSFAFTQICVKVIPGAWFFIYVRLAIVAPAETAPVYTDWKGPISLGYQACFPVNVYGYGFDGAIVAAQIDTVLGQNITCTPNVYLQYPLSPGTYTYNVWGVTAHVICKSTGMHSA